MENKTVTLSRHLALVALVSKRPGISVELLAELLSVPTEVVLEDIYLLDEVGIGDLLPGEIFYFDLEVLAEQKRVELIYHVDLGPALPLTGREVSYLLAGLAGLAPELTEEELAEVPKLLADVLALSGSNSAPDVEDLLEVLSVTATGPTRQAAITVREAMNEGKCLHLDYLSAGGKRSTRIVEPTSLTQMEDGWVLEAWCQTAAAERSFRLDRMVSVQKSDEPVEKRVARARRTKTPTCQVTLDKDSRWVLGELPITSLTEDEDTLTVTFKVFDDRWMVSQLILLSPHVLSVTPPKYAAMARERAQQVRQSRKVEEPG